MVAERFELAVSGSPTTALLYRAPAGGARHALVLAHGAGGRQVHPWMVAVARAIAALGVDVVTFDFLYAHAGRRVPDRNDVLEATWRAALARAREIAAREGLFIGGKSMGGRIASQVAATPGAGDLAGVLLLGYPLHPPGKPGVLRAAHLPRVKAPMLFVQGSRDAFGSPEELRPVLAPLPSAELVVFEGDHSLAPSRRARPDAIADDVSKVAVAWMDRAVTAR